MPSSAVAARLGIPNRQQMFAYEFMRDLNATQAAIRAGYSEATAATTGSELLRKPSVVALVKRLGREKLQAMRATPNRVISELSDIAFGKAHDELSYTAKNQALDRLGKYLKLFGEDVNVNINVVTPVYASAPAALQAGDQAAALELEASYDVTPIEDRLLTAGDPDGDNV